MKPLVLGYIRVSTDEQESSGLGLEAQQAAVRAFCGHASIVREVISTRKARRPLLDDALALLREEGGTLVVANMDRLCRDLGEFVAILSEVSQPKSPWSLVMLDLRVDTRTAAGRMAAHMRAAVAQFERDRISERTREALAAKRARGEPLGAPRRIGPAAELRIRELRDRGGLSYRDIARALNREHVPTIKGGSWASSTVAAVYGR